MHWQLFTNPFDPGLFALGASADYGKQNSPTVLLLLLFSFGFVGGEEGVRWWGGNSNVVAKSFTVHLITEHNCSFADPQTQAP